MTRILKALGLALGAMAMMVAVAAPAAQAETGELTAAQSPTIVTGEQAQGVTFDIGEGVGAVSCAVSRLEATFNGVADPVMFRPRYANCIAQPGALPATVTTNGCQYRMRFTEPGTTGWMESTGTMEAGIECPVGQQIEIHVYQNPMAHAENVSMCTYDVLPQPPVQAGVYHNVVGMPDDVTATVQARFTADSTIEPGMMCGGNMLNGHLPVTLTGNYTLQAYEDVNGVEGEAIALHVG
jgi:hypothetical protein